jgi:hypothetical protein
MLHTMPVSNCMHFILPTKLEDWKSYEVAGVIGVLGKDENGQYNVVDAFPVEQIPAARQLMTDERFGDWVAMAGSLDHLRFDVFLMPQTDEDRRHEVVTLLERSCGFKSNRAISYAHAV